MVKVFALIPRRPDVTEEFFHEHWAGPHAEFAQRITTIRRYVQSHRIDGPQALAPAPYEGVAEVWFDDKQTAAGMGEDPNYANYAHVDEPNFIDVDHLAFLMTAERVVRPGQPTGPEDAPVKTMLLLRRAPGIEPHELGERFGQLDGVVSSAQRVAFSVALADSYADGAEPVYDAVGELTFESEEALAGAAGEIHALITGDLADLIDPTESASLIARELRVIWPAPVTPSR